MRLYLIRFGVKVSHIDANACVTGQILRVRGGALFIGAVFLFMSIFLCFSHKIRIRCRRVKTTTSDAIFIYDFLCRLPAVNDLNASFFIHHDPLNDGNDHSPVQRDHVLLMQKLFPPFLSCG